MIKAGVQRPPLIKMYELQPGALFVQLLTSIA